MEIKLSDLLNSEMLLPGEADEMPGIVDMLTTKRCGDCHLCCTALAVPEIHKGIGERCQHLDQCGKCSIYERRPGNCKIFYCTWRIQEILKSRMPDNMKPNVCGFVLHWDKGRSVVCTLFPDPDRPLAWTKYKRKLEWFARTNDCAVVIGGGTTATHYVTPKGNWFSRADYPLYFEEKDVGIPSSEFRRKPNFPVHMDPYAPGEKRDAAK